MSLVPGVNNPAIDNLVLESKYLRWIPYEEITRVKPAQISTIHYARSYDDKIMLLCLGNNGQCTQTLVSEFAKIYSLPTHKHNNYVNQFRRYKEWLRSRNKLIKGFTKYDDMVASIDFYHCYSRYGFCAACGILRCSPVWCICGHKQLSDGWTSNNNQLDE